MTASLELADPNTDPFEVAAAAAAVIAERTGAERHDVAPVSYTHLDVYKRQCRG